MAKGNNSLTFNATFYNISDLSWRSSFILVVETRHIESVISGVYVALMVIGTDFMG
jgi:hypothetical protein